MKRTAMAIMAVVMTVTFSVTAFAWDEDKKKDEKGRLSQFLMDQEEEK